MSQNSKGTKSGDSIQAGKGGRTASNSGGKAHRERSRPAGTPGTSARPRGRSRGAAPPKGAAREALLAAARAEFDEAGFEGTDTNRIARRAGYAPQTFYRHFADKTAVFLEAYHRWVAEEWTDLEQARGVSALDAARVLLRHHARHRAFRRSLRRLASIDPAVRNARATSRRLQLRLLARDEHAGNLRSSAATRIAMILAIERIADAAADGELADLGLSGKQQAAMLADVILRFQARS